jgi:predicted dehydrogenase/nucleoside-diphosphate-sugar epimerase
MTLKVAIVGAGKMAGSHVQAIAQLPDAEVVAVVDVNREQAGALAERTGARLVPDLDALLAPGPGRPDVVHVLTPPQTHAAVAVRVLQAGIHALVEKPMALTTEEARQMLRAAEASSAKLGTVHNYLFKPSIRRARELVAAGAIGDVLHVYSYYGLSGEGAFFRGRGHWAWRLPGGPLTNFVPHMIYLQRAFLPGTPKVAGVAVDGTLDDSSAEMTALLQGDSASGVIHVSMRGQPYMKFIDVYGTRGMVHADMVREICVVHREQRFPRMISKALFSIEEAAQQARGTTVNAARVATGKMANMPELAPAFQNFYESIRTGHETPLSGDEGFRMVELMEQLWARLPARKPTQPRPATRRGPRTAAEQTVAAKGWPGPVLVTGATGFLGGHLVAALARCGADVVAPVRDRGRVSLELEQQAHVVAADVRDTAALDAAMKGVSIVIHCAAVTANNVAWAKHHDVNVKGSRAVFEAALRAGVERIVHVSSVAVYSDQPAGSIVDESIPRAPRRGEWSNYSRSKLEAEEVAFELLREKNLPVTVVRLGLLYGPGGRSIGRGLAELGRFRLVIGREHNVLPYTHVGNAVDALLLAALAPDAAGKVYNVVDDQIHDVRYAAKLASNGDRLTSVYLPESLLLTGARVLEWRARRRGSEAPPRFSRYVVRSACRDLRYDTARARHELGWKPEIGLEEGVRSSAEAFNG